MRRKAPTQRRRAPRTRVLRPPTTSTYNQGKYTPRHPEKYNGNVDKITFRSSWELEYNRFLDNNKNILEWSSEEIAIPYIQPTTKRVHRYFPDYWIKYRNKAGQIVQEIIEVKPAKEANNAIFLIEHDFKVMPPCRAKNPKTRTYEQLTTLINAAKWRAAMNFCHKYGMKFRIVTEHQLFR